MNQVIVPSKGKAALLGAFFSIFVGCATVRHEVTLSNAKQDIARYQCVVVAPFDNLSRYAGAGKVASDAVAGMLTESQQFKVVERGEAQRYLQSINAEENANLDPSQAAEMGKAMHADGVLIGAVSDFGYRSIDAKPEVAMTLRMVDVKKGKIVYVASASYRPEVISATRPLLTLASRSVAEALLQPLHEQEPGQREPKVLVPAACGFEYLKQMQVAAVIPPPVQVTVEIAEPVSAPVPVSAPEIVSAPVLAEPIVQPVNAPPALVMTPAVLKLIRKMDVVKNFVLEKVDFEIDKVSFKSTDYESVLDNLGQAMLARPTLKIRFEAHTDGLGDANFNRQVTQQRADVLKNYLTSKYQIEPARVEAVGFGGDKPTLPNINRKNREANRRVELTVVEGP